MSITGLNPDIDRLYGNTFHHNRNDSSELDVFEAARYFSGDPTETRQGGGDHYNFSRGTLGRRNSLDIPAARSHYYMKSNQNQNQNQNQKQGHVIKDKKYKQPSSPGGRLATFLNSLFTQSAKKKPKPASPDDEEFPGARRRRRSSISHFSFGNNDKNSPSVSSKSSGHRSPPEAYPHAPAKNDPRSISGHKKALHGREITKNPESSWLDLEKFRFRDGLSDKKSDFHVTATNVQPSFTGPKDHVTSCTHVFKDEEYDEGAESDSSSDLFELRNYDYSTGLPVYETTQPESIKRGAPISASGQ